MAAPIPLLVHATHEAGLKVGGIGAVLDGLLSAPSYLDSVQRTVLVGPMNANDPVHMERINNPHTGKKPGGSFGGFMGHGGQTEMGYHGTGQLGGKQVGEGNPNAAAKSDDKPG